MILLTLPMPPSTNSLFANVSGKGRVRTERYKTWANAAGWIVKAARLKPVSGQVDIYITVGPPRKGWDASNRIKAVEDLLVQHGVLSDDSWPVVRKVSAEWSESVKGCSVAVFPVEAE